MSDDRQRATGGSLGQPEGDAFSGLFREALAQYEDYVELVQLGQEGRLFSHVSAKADEVQNAGWETPLGLTFQACLHER